MNAERPMRVLEVVDCLNGGGAQTALLEWIRRLPRDRFQVDVVSLFGPGLLSQTFAGAGFPPAHLSPFRWNPAIPLRLAPWLRRDYDVVHAHLVISSFLCERMMSPRRLGRLIVHVQNPVAASGRYQDWIERHAYRRAGTVLACSRHVLNTVGLCRNGEALHNTINMEHFHPFSAEERAAARARFGLAEERPVFVAAGRLAPQKNHALLLDAFASVRVKLPRALLLLAGDGPLRGALDAQARTLGLGGSLRFVGFQEDVRDVLAAGDVYVLSSRYEGLSLSLLEAMACGLPCVSTFYPGADEALEDGMNGRLVPPDDVPAFAAALKELGANPTVREVLGRAARESVEDRFSADATAARLTTIYEALSA